MRTSTYSPLHRRPPRRGTVMVMVVALLVLLALIGTAWIATVRYDRGASQANVANAYIDLVAQGARDMIVSRIAVEDLHGRQAVGGPRFYRARQDGNTASYSFEAIDSPMPDPALTPLYSTGAPNIYTLRAHADNFLASRVPARLPNAVIYWPTISAPPIPIPNPADGRVPQRSILTSYYVFESPALPRQNNARVNYPRQFRQRTSVVPSFIDLTLSDNTTRTFPAVRIAGHDGQPRDYLAADTDGDGVADAALFRLPVAEQDGITYYAAYRAIDNNSALNASVAYQSQRSASGIGINFFPSNVDLLNVIMGNDAAQLNALQIYRQGGTGYNGQALLDDGSSAGFAWTTPFEALWFQLGRRAGNPGWNTSTIAYRALGLTDQIALAHRFILANPANVSSLENTLRPTLVTNAPTQRYALNTNDIRAWYDQNFDYANANYNRRPLLVARNPVSNVISAASPGGASALTVPPAIQAAGATYGNIPVKANLNTSEFKDLWLAYWNVMCERPTHATDTSPFGYLIDTTPALQAHAGPANSNPYYGQGFTQTDTGPFTSSSSEQNPWRMFRSSLRDIAGNGTTRFTPAQQVLLRSAIAAANTVQMRSTAATYLPQTVQLQARVGGSDADVEVKIYPVRPQPFISEVYVNTDTRKVDKGGEKQNRNGYFAIELYNPTGAAIDLTGWRLFIVKRTGSYPLNLQPLAAPNFGSVTSIAPQECVVFENYGTTGQAAQYRAGPVGNLSRAISVPDLHQAAGNELLIMRPATSGMVPVDQFDFTGLEVKNAPPQPDPTFEVRSWHYVRNTRDSWKCVYPGRYDGRKSERRHQGTELRKWKPDAIPAQNEPSYAIPVTMGARGMTPGTYPTGEFTIQLTNANWPTPKTGASFPRGMFARDGDALKVPFIAAYTVYRNGQLIEVNSVSMDSVFAEDTDTTNDLVENVGRFTPVWRMNGSTPVMAGSDYDSRPGQQAYWRYRWAMKLFNHLTVNAPHHDFQPDMPGQAANRTVANADPAHRNDEFERTVGVDGLVNLNTAPAKVLECVPFHPDMTTNRAIVQSLVAYRELFGPFQNIFDVYRALMIEDPPNVRWAGFTQEVNRQHGVADGDETPDSIMDFEDQYALLNRVSSMLTVRSDTFTCYILVQGWRGVGVTNADPELVAQRRIGVIIDRNAVTKDKLEPKITMFPVE